MGRSKHIYMTQETQEIIALLKEKLNTSSSGVVAAAVRAMKNSEEAVNED